MLSGTVKVYIRNKKYGIRVNTPISKENIDELVNKFKLAQNLRNVLKLDKPI